MEKQLSNAPKERQQIPQQFQWDLTALYPNASDWEVDFNNLKASCQKLDSFRGRLGQGAVILKQMLEARDSLNRLAAKISTYAHLKADENTTNTQGQALDARSSHLMTELMTAQSWIEPELLALSDTLLQKYVNDPNLQEFRRPLEILLREKPHTLSAAEEKLLNLASEALDASSHAFNMLSDADLRFPTIQTADGKSATLTQGNFVTFMESQHRPTRQSAFETYFGTYAQYQNTLAAQLSGHIKSRIFYAKARGFKSARAAALFPDQVDEKVYDQLIENVRQRLDIHDRYTEIRKKILGINDLQPYDLYTPLVERYELSVPYSQAYQWIQKATEPLGQEYQSALNAALEQRWVDAYESLGKRSGGYSSGCYDSHPYILMNYKDNLDSAFTLAHELGHSIHSYFSRKYQPHATHDYKIFVAEVASTTNETLLFHSLLQEKSDPRFKAYLINHFCNSFKGTVYRQTMFAEFESRAYQSAESGEALTHEKFSELYFEIAKTYLGKNVSPHPLLKVEWSRIPHFFNYSFYVYKYATGFAAAQVFAQKILAKEKGAVDRYLEFLKTGNSLDPLETLARAGVDLRSPNTVKDALNSFDYWVKELQKCLATDQKQK